MISGFAKASLGLAVLLSSSGAYAAQSLSCVVQTTMQTAIGEGTTSQSKSASSTDGSAVKFEFQQGYKPDASDTELPANVTQILKITATIDAEVAGVPTIAGVMVSDPAHGHAEMKAVQLRSGSSEHFTNDVAIGSGVKVHYECTATRN